MPDSFQTECLQLRARIGRLRRRTDRHLNEVFRRPTWIGSVHSILGKTPTGWDAAIRVTRHLLARKRTGRARGDGSLDDIERLVREAAIWLQRLYRKVRSMLQNNRHVPAPTAEEPTHD